VIRGYGEHHRLRRQRMQGWAIFGMVCVCTGLVLALLASPALNKRQQVLELNAALEAVKQKVAPVMAEREALSKTNQRLRAVAAFADGHVDPRDVLGQLSAILPDSVYLTRFDLKGRTVTISGLADNAASINETLGGQAEFREVRMPSAINRDPTTGKEAFTVEFKRVDTGVVK
jgi:prepilin-type processing-associated H-X9-DG protein